jgi:hypothetical protein
MTPPLRSLYKGGWLGTPCLKATAQGIGPRAPPSGIKRNAVRLVREGRRTDESAVAAVNARATPRKRNEPPLGATNCRWRG